jgi:hypothetical protein
MSQEQDYDVVLDTLQQKIDVLWKLHFGVGIKNGMETNYVENGFTYNW